MHDTSIVVASPAFRSVHGEAEPVIDPANSARAAEFLKARSADARMSLLGLGHGIDARAARAVVEALDG